MVADFGIKLTNVMNNKTEREDLISDECDIEEEDKDESFDKIFIQENIKNQYDQTIGAQFQRFSRATTAFQKIAQQYSKINNNNNNDMKML